MYEVPEEVRAVGGSKCTTMAQARKDGTEEGGGEASRRVQWRRRGRWGAEDKDLGDVAGILLGRWKSGLFAERTL